MIHFLLFFLVCWKPPKHWRDSDDHVLVVELHGKHKKHDGHGMYESNTRWQKRISRLLSSANPLNFIRVDLNKKIIDLHEVEKITVKIQNTEYELSQQSKEVLIKDAEKRSTRSCTEPKTKPRKKFSSLSDSWTEIKLPFSISPNKTSETDSPASKMHDSGDLVKIW